MGFGFRDPAVLVDLKPVWLTVIGRDQGKLARRRDPEYLPVRDVRHIKVAVAIEGRAFEKAIAGDPALSARVVPGAQ
jgi:hypothetical protein